jgi:hypothetical protein
VPDPGQRLLDLRGLDLELALVGQHLPRRARVVGDLRQAVGRGLEDLDRARLGVGALGLADDRAHPIAGQRARHEDDVAVAARDAVAAVGERIDGQVELVAAARAGGGWGGGGHASEDDSRAARRRPGYLSFCSTAARTDLRFALRFS